MSGGGQRRLPALSAALAAAPAGTAMAQTFGQGAAAPFPWLRWALALIFCLALALAGGLALKVRLGGAASRRLRWDGAWRGLLGRRPDGASRLTLVTALRVNPTLEVCLLRCDEAEYLVAATPQGVVQLSPSPHAAAPAKPL